jgi:hypothetical protein
MRDVMIDLETLGRRAGCSVLSIGAVAFDAETGELGPEFYAVVNRDSCAIAGLHEDPETIAWWDAQSCDAKTVLLHAEEGGLLLPDALQRFTIFLLGFDVKKVKVWGNGGDFDNTILTACYASIGETTPWDFWNNRCYRTLKNLAPQIKLERTGTYHNALDDAMSQARHAIKLLQHLEERANV